ncbi:MAG: hypothetical protein SGARI_000003, partial [Bacillariaceae sp.]
LSLKLSASLDTITMAEEEQQQQMQQIAELHTLIRYLRREKEIVEGECELARTEASRAQVQAAVLTKGNDKLREDVRRLQSLSNSNVQEKQEQEKMLAQVQQMTLYRESMLRAENERNAGILQKTKAQVEELKGKINPLKQNEVKLKAELEVLKAALVT